ncbi:MAG: caspase family protein, partial [Candidatus Eremiobacteraeota bacterium]|nr:caspase family protein [Candidatus Eremiobacteraeota bacterium]
IPATKQLLILDSCKSGAAVGVLGRYYAARSGLEEIRSQQLLAKTSGTFLIAATKADDYAYEVPELGHGVLTFAILEALGKTKKSEVEVPDQVTVNDLLRSVSSRVPVLSQKYQGVNQQVLQYSCGQDFLLEDRGRR